MGDVIDVKRAAARQDDLDGPVVQSIGIGFRVLYAVIAVLAAAWVASNWRQVPADSQAVVLRFGRITGLQQAGLVLSWPRPIGQVVLVPGPERRLTLPTESFLRPGGLVDLYTQASGVNLPQGAGLYLTGDGGAVLLSATITYQVSDGAAYYLAQAHVGPALQRLFRASAVHVAAARGLDDVLVARPDQAGADPARMAAAESRRQAMRGDLVHEINGRLAELARDGAPLGVTVSRIDLDATLPPAAKIAFDGVLVAVQLAEQTVAGARTEATRTRQAGDRERDNLLAAARASAQERVGAAQASTAGITALQASMAVGTRSAVMDQYYRDQLALLLHKVGRVTAVDPAATTRLMLPATPPIAGGSP